LKLRELGTDSQGRILRGVGVAALLGLACAGPISTMRSPYHLRIVEVRNATEETQTLKIEPTAEQHLGAATTFTGLLAPGEVKVLYLYHGLEYDIRILDAPGWTEVTRTTLEVDRDLELVYHGDSLRTDVQFNIGLGEPVVTFSDSLQMIDPFGLRSRRVLEPDTTQLRGPEDPNRIRRRGDQP
jgi:hypothetical protein